MFNGKKFLLAGLAGGGALVSGTAYATELNFSYVSSFAPLQVTADWIQSSSPVPLSFVGGISTTVAAAGSDTALLFGIPIYTGSFTEVTFNSTLYGGGFSGADLAFDYGSQIYSGSEAGPFFSVGVFTLGNGTLTISAVPEPASWVLMIVGFGVIGLAARRRPRANVMISFA